MSKLPRGWADVALADVAEVNPRKLVNLSLRDYVTFVPMAAVDEVSGTIAKPIERPLKEVSKGFTQFAENDVLFAKITPSMENGKSAIATGLINGIGFGSTEFHVFRSTGAVLPTYLWRFVRQQGFRDNAQKVMSGAVGQQRVPAEYLKEQRLPLPPLPEQKRNVAKIDSITGRTARARTDLGRIPALVAKYRETILTQAFTGRLSDDWRDPRSIPLAEMSRLAERIGEERTIIRAQKGLRNEGKNRSRPVANFELPAVPRSWVWLTFDECSWDMTVGHVGPMKDRYVESGIPFLRSMNVRPNRVDLSNVAYIDEAFHKELRKSEIRAGELLVVRTGAPGTAAVVPEDLGVANCSDLVIARLVPSLNPHFAAFYMNSQFARAAVRGMQVGVAQQHFNVGSMSEMPVPVPSVEEQAEIVRCIENAFAWLDRVSADHASASKLLPQTRRCRPGQSLPRRTGATGPKRRTGERAGEAG